MVTNTILVDTRFTHADQSVQGKIEVTENSVQISIAGRDVKIELYGGQIELEVFNKDCPAPYLVHVWPAVETKCSNT
jgi:hypothetical protein